MNVGNPSNVLDAAQLALPPEALVEFPAVKVSCKDSLEVEDAPL